MTGLRRTPRIGKVLAAGALIGLVGCQQVPSRPGARSPLGWGNEPKGGGRTITPAQEADVQISMGRAAEQQGNLDQAMAAYRAALDRDKSRADAYARLAILHDKQGKFRESAELYRKALALRPGDPDIFCDMGYSLYLQRRWAEAEMNLRQAIAVNADHRRAHNNLALLLVRDNRLDDALAEFGKAGSDPVQAHMNLAFALTIDQRWESARAEYQRALALDPSSQLAKARLDRVERPARQAGAGPGRTAPGTTRRCSRPRPRPPPRGAAWPDPTPAPPRTAIRPVRRPARPGAAHDRGDLPPPPRGTDPGREVPIPPLPAEGGAMQRLWAIPDSASERPADAPARRPRQRTPPRRPRPSDEPPDRNPTPPRRTHSSSLPLLAIDSPGRPHQPAPAAPTAHHPPAAVLRCSADHSAGRPSPGSLNSDRATPAHSDAPLPQRPARPRLRTRTRSPWIRPGNPPSAPDGPGDPDDRSPGRQPASGGFSWGAPH